MIQVGLFNWKNGKDGNTPANATNLNLAQQQMIETIYPVGSIYMSMNPTNPKDLFFCGEWEQIKGRFLLGTGTPSANTDNYFGAMSGFEWNAGPGSTGGQDYHRLTIDEIPAHNHDILRPTYFNDEVTGAGDILGTNNLLTNSVRKSTEYAGSGAVHNNMPPYLAVYMWKRTS